MEDNKAKVESKEYGKKINKGPEYFFPSTISDIKGFAIFMMNPNGIITYWNRGCEVMKGYQSEEIIGQHYQMLFPDFLIAKHLPEQELDEAYKTGKYDTENWRLKKSGELFWAYVVLTKLVDEQGECIGYVKITQDHTERKKLEDELNMKNEALERINNELEAAKERTDKDLDGFVYTASHDLKAPIANMEGLLNAFTAQECYQDKKSRPLFDMLIICINRLKQTIGELTEISRIQKSIEDDVEQIAIIELLEEVKASLAELIEETGAQVDIDVDRSSVIKFSRRNLKNIIYNLLNNALKYHSPQRSPTILVRGEVMDGYYVLMVKDNGLGIKKEHLDKVFLMFKRFHSHVQGTGIGLYMVKRIIENAKGKIVLESELGEGSTFKIFLKA
jgi:PAS domain S-box-containing protein